MHGPTTLVYREPSSQTHAKASPITDAAKTPVKSGVISRQTAFARFNAKPHPQVAATKSVQMKRIMTPVRMTAQPVVETITAGSLRTPSIAPKTAGPSVVTVAVMAKKPCCFAPTIAKSRRLIADGIQMPRSFPVWKPPMSKAL